MAITDNLISHWSLEETSGGAADDHGSNDLSAAFAPGSVTGRVGNARSFNGGSSYQELYVATNSALETGDVDFTCAAWVRPVSVDDWCGVFVKTAGSGDSNCEYALHYMSSRFRLMVRDAADANTVALSASNAGNLATDGTWYFVVFWHDATANELGIAVYGAASSTPNTASHSGGVLLKNTGHVVLGAFVQGAGGWGASYIDEVGFWKRVLTSEERTWLYNAGNGRAYSEFAPAAPAWTPRVTMVMGG